MSGYSFTFTYIGIIETRSPRVMKNTAALISEYLILLIPLATRKTPNSLVSRSSR